MSGEHFGVDFFICGVIDWDDDAMVFMLVCAFVVFVGDFVVSLFFLDDSIKDLYGVVLHFQ